MNLEFDIDIPSDADTGEENSSTNSVDTTKATNIDNTNDGSDNDIDSTKPNNLSDDVGGDDTSADSNNDDNSVDTDDSSTDDVPFYATILENSGLEFSEEELALFSNKEDTIETLNETVDFVINKKLETQRQSLLSEHDEVQALYYHLKSGGELKDFAESIQQQNKIESLSISKDDVVSQRYIVKEYLKKSGMNDKLIDATIKSYESSDTLYDTAKSVQPELKEQLKQQRSLGEQKYLEQQQAAEQAYLQEIENAKTLAKQGKILNAKIDPKEANSLVDFVYNIGEDGASEYAKKAQSLNTEQILAIAYLVKNDFNFESFINKEVNTKRVKDIRSYLKGKTSGSRQQSSGNTSFPDVSLDKLEFSN